MCHSAVFHQLQISRDAQEVMIDEYKRLRQRDSSGGTTKTSWRITVRQLESMIRLSEAMARMYCQDEVGQRSCWDEVGKVSCVVGGEVFCMLCKCNFIVFEKSTSTHTFIVGAEGYAKPRYVFKYQDYDIRYVKYSLSGEKKSKI